MDDDINNRMKRADFSCNILHAPSAMQEIDRVNMSKNVIFPCPKIKFDKYSMPKEAGSGWYWI